MIHELDFLDRRWYFVSREYVHASEAVRAWERLERRGKALKGALELGVYRHGPPVGDRADARYVTAVGHVREGAEAADRMLGGIEYEIDPELARGMIARRIRVMAEVEAEGVVPEGGRALIVRRGTKRGAHLNPDGTMDERIGEG